MVRWPGDSKLTRVQEDVNARCWVSPPKRKGSVETSLRIPHNSKEKEKSFENMASPHDSKRGSTDAKVGVEWEEDAPIRDPLLERYELIRDKTPEELKALDKSVRRCLDWKFLPMVCAMLMMK